MSTFTYARTFNSSELSRNLKPVFEAVESQPVLVTRRDGENLVLMTEHEADERRDMFAIAAQIIAATTLEGGSLAERMATVFPWMLALDTGDRELCARELIDTARAAFATNQPKTLLVGMTSWFESTTALAAWLNQSVDTEGDPIDLTRIHNAAVDTELRRKLQEGTLAFFEKAVVDLLWAMGYGGPHGEREHLGKSGDGGIDGVIRQDALGLNKVYIQAKRYADGNSGGRPSIQQFFGSLSS